MSYKHYGKTLEKMIKLAADYPEGEEKEQLVWLVLNHMKKSYVQWNKEVDDSRIFFDLYDLSGRKLDFRNSELKLVEMREAAPRKQQQMQQRSRKK
jgi:hypothetical protein